MIIIALIGLPGSGKTSQAMMLRKYGLKCISTGQLLRDISEEDVIDKSFVLEKLNSGNHIDPEITSILVGNEIIKARNYYIGASLDGSPRSVKELDNLYKILKKEGLKFSAIIHLDLPVDMAVERLLIRARDDDNIEAIQRRIIYYHEVTSYIFNYILKKYPSIPINMIKADNSRTFVRNEILTILNNYGLI